jgi:DNA polymerase IV (DinB-like DNA polymerase)
MLVDLDYFFAQAEEVRNPSIRDKPVVVCVYSGRSEDSGAVSTSNYAARRYGIKSGMPIVLAKRRLQDIDAVFLPVDHALYDQVSDRTMSILRSRADSFEQVSVDEAYLDVSQRTTGDFEQARALAQEIKDDVRAQQGLACSVGIGPNKLVAKIAADAQKPDGLTTVKPEDIGTFLSPLPVDSILGIGAKTKEKMQVLGIRTIGDLAKHDAQRLIQIFGRNLGVYFHNASLGIDDEPVRERGEAESISRIATLKEDTRDLNAIFEKTSQLCSEVHAALVQQGVCFRTVGITVVMTDLSTSGRSRTLDAPADELRTLIGTVRTLFEKLLAETSLKARRVGVRVSGLVKPQKSQKQLTSFLEPDKS